MALIESRAADISLYVKASQSGALLEAECLVFLIGAFTFESGSAVQEQARILGQFYRDWGISAVPVVVRWGIEQEPVEGARDKSGMLVTLHAMSPGSSGGPINGLIPFIAPSKGMAIHLAGPHLLTETHEGCVSAVLGVLLEMVSDREPSYAAALYGTCLEMPPDGLTEYWEGILEAACYLSRCDGGTLQIRGDALRCTAGAQEFDDLRLLPASALVRMGVPMGEGEALCSRCGWGLSIDDLRHIVRIHQVMAETATKAQLSQMRDTFHDTLCQLSELTRRYRELREAFAVSKERAPELRARVRKSYLKRAKASVRQFFATWPRPRRQAGGVLSVRRGTDQAEW